jgi:2-polyprenyl-6-methoxyphenol hydroxylase-like FAD-dependent oxidoreductase
MRDVVVVGGGPTGLLLAAELRLAGAEPLVVEADGSGERQTRSLGLRGLNGRTVQSLGLRGLAEPLAEVQWALLDALMDAPGGADEVGQLLRMLRTGRVRGHFSGLPLIESDDEESGIPQGLLLKQHQLESAFAERAVALGVELRSGSAVVNLAQDDEGVTVVLADGSALRARYVVGCDGGRSAVRKLAGIGFPGTEATMTGRTARARLADPAQVPSSLRSPRGVVNQSLVQGEIATIEFDGGPDERDTPMTAEELQASIRRVSGVEATVAWIGAGTRYSDNTRLAETYRKGRVLLAGDAAHVHSPIGGQGLNLGLQDAMNLGWKLGLVALGLAGPELLDTYTAERQPVAERVLRFTRAQVALMRPGAQTDALRDVLGEVIALPPARRLFIDAANGTDISYAGARSPAASPRRTSWSTARTPFAVAGRSRSTARGRSTIG